MTRATHACATGSVRFAVGLVLCLSLVCAGCGSDSPSSPSGGPGASSGGVAFFWGVALSGAGRYSLTFNGQTYSGTGPYNVSLSPGTYEMSGTYTGGTLILTFFSAGTPGGVQSGSVRSVSGPVTLVQSCGLAYSDLPQTTQSFRVQFTVTNNPNSSC